MSLDIVTANSRNPNVCSSLCQYVCEITGQQTDFGPCVALGVLSEGKLQGAVILHDWQRDYGTIELSGAAHGKYWLSRRLMKKIASICFDDLACQTIVAYSAAGNTKAKAALTRIGFEHVVLPNRLGKGIDGAYYHLSADRWQDTRASQ